MLVVRTFMLEFERFCSTSSKGMYAVIENRWDEYVVKFLLKFWIALQLFAELTFPFDMDFIAMSRLRASMRDIVDR